jgi:2-polyprenyl-6-methoxyphenol hydroxylase-like FAD-dependent oxidoreductase
MNRIGEHAVVLGASMAGMLAARVLADFYPRVTVVDRDELADTADERRGAPQGRHAHALLGRGSQIMGELFPGLLDGLVADGAPVWSDGDLSQVWLSFGGHQMVRSGTVRDPMSVYMASRPLLECRVRRHLRAIPNVTVLDGHDLAAITATPVRDRITGVRISRRDGTDETTVAADLVVDATGRGSRTPAFLDSLGYGRPPEDEVVVHQGYRSQRLRMPPGTMAERLAIVNVTPQRPTMMALLGNENDTAMFSVGAMLGHELPDDRAGMLAFAEEFAPAHVVAAARAGEPIGQVARYKIPSNRWRRYDRMRRMPQGLLVFGDAICSFNPIYGQGMTVAALEALALRGCLRGGDRDLPTRFFDATAKVIGTAWQMAVGSDLSLPGTEGRRSASMRLAALYTERVVAAAASDPFVAERFMRTTGMIDPPIRLLHPSVLLRVVAPKFRAHRSEAVAPQPVGSAP